MVQGVTVIPVGSPAVGEITDVRNKGMWGKSGNSPRALLYLTVNGRQIRLTGGFDDKGVAGGVGAVAVSAIVFLPAGFFMTGTSARVPAGTIIKAFVDEDVPLAMPPAAPRGAGGRAGGSGGGGAVGGRSSPSLSRGGDRSSPSLPRGGGPRAQRGGEGAAAPAAAARRPPSSPACGRRHLPETSSGRTWGAPVPLPRHPGPGPGSISRPAQRVRRAPSTALRAVPSRPGEDGTKKELSYKPRHVTTGWFSDSAWRKPMTDQSDPPKPPRPAEAPLTCTRATPRQGTSYMAFRGEPLEDGDPLLGFKPVLSKQAPRHNSITPQRQRAFISALAASGIVVDAARHIGVSTEALYRLRNKPGGEEFRAAWDMAVDRAMARLEAGAFKRALHGEERLAVSAGQLMGTEVRHNDALVMFFLRNRRGERYAPDWRHLRPGNPIYEKIAAEGVERHLAAEPSEEEVKASLIEFLEGLRARRLASEKILAEAAGAEGEERGDGGDEDGEAGGE